MAAGSPAVGLVLLVVFDIRDIAFYNGELVS